jgi:molybdate transport system ATP-binding protein
MNKPKLLLMDEPLSALDLNMRKKLQNEILKLHNEFKTTTIIVSHDPNEIYNLASRVITLKDGKIISNDVPKDILVKGELLSIEQIDGVRIAKVILSEGELLV